MSRAIIKTKNIDQKMHMNFLSWLSALIRRRLRIIDEDTWVFFCWDHRARANRIVWRAGYLFRSDGRTVFGANSYFCYYKKVFKFRSDIGLIITM